MRLRCIASWGSKRSLPIARIPLSARSTWNCNCELVYENERSATMKKLFLLIIVPLIIVALFASTALAADSKSVSYKSGGETVQAVLYTPAGKGPFPAIIVIHEWWGLNDWVKDQAAKLAGEGYVASQLICIAARWPRRQIWPMKSCAEFRKTAPSAICMQLSSFC